MTPVEASVNAYLDEFVRRSFLRTIASTILQGFFWMKAAFK